MIPRWITFLVSAPLFLSAATIAHAAPVGAHQIFRGILPYSSEVPALDRYPEEVAIFAPETAPEKPEIILHLHGWRVNRPELGGRLETFDDVLAEFHFDHILSASGRDAYLVVPSSQGHCTSFESHLSTPVRLNYFLNALATVLKIDMSVHVPFALTLTGHSGAYRTLAAILETSAIYSELFPTDQMIREVDLLDASYGQSQTFADFLLAPENKSKRFRSVYRPTTETEAGSHDIWALIHGLDPASVPMETFYKNTYLPEVTADQLKNVQHAFIASDQDHWGTVNQYLPILLKN